MTKKILHYISFLIFTYFIFILIIGYFNIPKISKKFIEYKIGSYGHLNSRIKELKNIDYKLDVLFIGSSHTYRGFDPRYYNNLKTFNLGSSSQTPLQTNILLKRYLKKVDPKLIVYEVYPETFKSKDINPALDLISNDKNDINSLKMVLEYKNFKLFNTYIYALTQDLLNLNNNFIESKIKKDDKYIKGGFVEKELKFAKKEKHIHKIVDIDSTQFNYFKKNIEFINNNGNEIILVYAPISKSLYNSILNKNEIDNMYESLGLDYYNFNKIIDINDSLDLYDSHHLNNNGIKKLNILLNSIINKKRNSK